MIDELIRNAEPLEEFAQQKPGGAYFIEDGAMFWRANADTERQLVNADIRILADVSLDDGAETRRVFEIEALHRGRTVRFTLPAEKFAAMNWVVEYLGATAILYPGQSVREHTRVAIQTLSGDIPTRREYTHTGWAMVNGERVYLSGSGAIGAAGLIPGIEVTLSGTLSGYELPAPPDDEQLKAAIRASLAMLDVAPRDVTSPVYAAVWRAPLGQIDLSLHLVAPTGAGKSELSGLAVQHFGAGMDARHLPGSWSSTANALEALGFQAKDTIFPIDDFAPTGSNNDVARQHRDADRVFRGTGNNSSRVRMRADTSIREPKPIRALVLSSGEDTPKGESLRARVFIVDMAPDSMRWARLTQCQHDALSGLYAQAMAGYVRWLASHGEAQFERFQRLRIQYREHADTVAFHRRTPAIVADLGAAFRLFVDYAMHAGALTAEQGRELWARVWAALSAVAAQQESYQAQSEPTRQFREYLAACIASGRAHLAAVNGEAPTEPYGWGWRLVGTGEHERWQAAGERVGWMADDGIYLEPKASYASVQAMAQRSGDSLAITSGQLRKSLKNKRLLLATDRARETLTVRKRIEGRVVDVLHVASSFLDSAPISQEPDKPDTEADSSPNASEPGDSVSDFVSDFVALKPEPDIEHSPETLAKTGQNGARVGNVGNVGFGGNGQRHFLENCGAMSGTLEEPDTKPDIGHRKSDIAATKCKACGSARTRGLACSNCGRTDSEALAYIAGQRAAQGVSPQ